LSVTVTSLHSSSPHIRVYIPDPGLPLAGRAHRHSITTHAPCTLLTQLRTTRTRPPTLALTAGSREEVLGVGDIDGGRFIELARNWWVESFEASDARLVIKLFKALDPWSLYAIEAMQPFSSHISSMHFDVAFVFRRAAVRSEGMEMHSPDVLCSGSQVKGGARGNDCSRSHSIFRFWIREGWGGSRAWLQRVSRLW
jgi:hypothetical protein